MEYSLQAIYYLLRGYINLLLQVEVTEGVTVGGVLFSTLILGACFVALGFIGEGLRFHADGMEGQYALPDKQRRWWRR